MERISHPTQNFGHYPWSICSFFKLSIEIGLTLSVMLYLQPCKVAQVVQLLQDGSSVRLVARRFGVSPSAVSRAWRRFRETGQYTRRAGQGRRRATTPRQDRHLVLTARRLGFVNARSLQNELRRATGVEISDQTVRNRLHRSLLRSRRPFVGVILTPRHRAARLDFAREHRDWQVRLGVQYSSQMRAGLIWMVLMDVLGSGDVKVNDTMQPTSSSVTDLAVGL